MLFIKLGHYKKCEKVYCPKNCQIYSTVIQLQLLCTQNLIYWFIFCCSYILMNIAEGYANPLLMHTYDANIYTEFLFIIYNKHFLQNIQIMVV